MANGIFKVPEPFNEPVLGYAPGSPERQELNARMQRLAGRVIDIPARIGGRKVRTGKLAEAVMPHDHAHVLGRWHKCGRREVDGVALRDVVRVLPPEYRITGDRMRLARWLAGYYALPLGEVVPLFHPPAPGTKARPSAGGGRCFRARPGAVRRPCARPTAWSRR